MAAAKRKKATAKKVPPPPPSTPVKSDNVEVEPQEVPPVEDTRAKTKVLYLSHTKPGPFQESMEKQVDHMAAQGYELVSHSHCVADVGMARAISAVGVYKLVYNLKSV